MPNQYGALVHGRRADTDVASTVETRPLDGGRLVALIALQGDLATPSLESVKGALARVVSVNDGAANKVATSAPPPPYAKGVAVVLLIDNVAHVAATGGARCYRERGGTLTELAAGTHAAEPGDAWIVASHASLRVGQAFFTTPVQPSTDTEFRNNTLDAALESALASHTALIAVAAARVDGS